MIFQDIAQSALDSDISSQEDSSDTDAAGSNQVNNMMAMLVGPLADNVASHPIMSDTIEEFLEGTDVAGLNYMTSRHTLHPNCIVLGTETFPSEIPRLWNIVKENNNVLGDLTWTGFDYLGEAGIGNFTTMTVGLFRIIGRIDCVLWGYRYHRDSSGNQLLP